MKTYTLHVSRDAHPGDAEALDRATLVQDGFSWGAFVFTVLWFLAHRLWIAALGVLVLMVAFNAALQALDVRPLAAFLAQALLSLLIGLEANSLRRWTLARRGRPAVDVVAAADQEEAETKAFARWLSRDTALRPVASAAPLTTPVAPYRNPDPVIGFFPEAERSR
jgi:hypothetical protein